MGNSSSYEARLSVLVVGDLDVKFLRDPDTHTEKICYGPLGR